MRLNYTSEASVPTFCVESKAVTPPAGEQIVATDAANVGKIRAGGRACSTRIFRAGMLGRAAELSRSACCYSRVHSQ